MLHDWVIWNAGFSLAVGVLGAGVLATFWFLWRMVTDRSLRWRWVAGILGLFAASVGIAYWSQNPLWWIHLGDAAR